MDKITDDLFKMLHFDDAPLNTVAAKELGVVKAYIYNGESTTVPPTLVRLFKDSSYRVNQYAQKEVNVGSSLVLLLTTLHDLYSVPVCKKLMRQVKIDTLL